MPSKHTQPHCLTCTCVPCHHTTVCTLDSSSHIAILVVDLSLVCRTLHHNPLYTSGVQGLIYQKLELYTVPLELEEDWAIPIQISETVCSVCVQCIIFLAITIAIVILQAPLLWSRCGLASITLLIRKNALALHGVTFGSRFHSLSLSPSGVGEQNGRQYNSLPSILPPINCYKNASTFILPQITHYINIHTYIHLIYKTESVCLSVCLCVCS